MTRKGQITLESLLLYGVAILVVLLAVGALTYFGILDLGRLLPDRCNLASAGTLSCDEWRVERSNVPSDADRVHLGLRNIGASALIVESVAFYPDGSDRDEQQQYCNVTLSGADRNLPSGSIEAYELVCGGQAITQSLGQKARGDLEIVYTQAGGAVEQRVGGQLIATVS